MPARVQGTEELAGCVSGRAEVARRHRRGAEKGDAVERVIEMADDARLLQHVHGATGHRDRFGSLQHVGMAWRHQHQVGKAHHLHRPRRSADIAGVAGAEQDEAGRVVVLGCAGRDSLEAGGRGDDGHRAG